MNANSANGNGACHGDPASNGRLTVATTPAVRLPRPRGPTMYFNHRETIMYRTQLRFAALLLAAPLLLAGCKDNADPVKPKVVPAAASTPAA